MTDNPGTWRDNGVGDIGISHWKLTEQELAKLRGAHSLTLWNVNLPHGQGLSAVPSLRWVDIRGGTKPDLGILHGCPGLQGVAVNQVRGLADLEALRSLTNLRILSLYGLSRLTALPDLSSLVHLKRLEIGQMRRLVDWSNLTSPPAIEELCLMNKLDPDVAVLRRLADHPTLRTFEWFAGDESDRKVQAARDAVGRPRTRAALPEEWLKQNT